jgi:hypothetical protein
VRGASRGQVGSSANECALLGLVDYVMTSPLLLQQATVALSKNCIDNREVNYSGSGTQPKDQSGSK